MATKSSIRRTRLHIKLAPAFATFEKKRAEDQAWEEECAHAREKLFAEARERDNDRYAAWLDRQREIDDAEYDRLTYRPR